MFVHKLQMLENRLHRAHRHPNGLMILDSLQSFYEKGFLNNANCDHVSETNTPDASLLDLIEVDLPEEPQEK